MRRFGSTRRMLPRGLLLPTSKPNVAISNSRAYQPEGRWPFVTIMPKRMPRLAANLLGHLPDSDFEAMQTLLRTQNLSNDERALLHFAVASVMDRRGRYSHAATHYNSGNIYQSSGKATRAISYDVNQHTRYIDQIITCFDRAILARTAGWGSRDPRPIFVIGFPRSGTTLTEQILSCAPPNPRRGRAE